MDNKKEWGGGFFKITKSISDFIFLNIKEKQVQIILNII